MVKNLVKNLLPKKSVQILICMKKMKIFRQIPSSSVAEAFGEEYNWLEGISNSRQGYNLASCDFEKKKYISSFRMQMMYFFWKI